MTCTVSNDVTEIKIFVKNFFKEPHIFPDGWLNNYIKNYPENRLYYGLLLCLRMLINKKNEIER